MSAGTVPAAVRHTTIGSLDIAWDPRVLEPRPWTALQSAWAAELLADAPGGRVLEVCSGAGHIGLLAVVGTDRRLLCVDLDPVACDYARRNAAAAGIADRVEVRVGSLGEVAAEGDDPGAEVFAVVIADPPWVPSEGTGRFPDDPVLAIDGGPDGLGPARECLRVVDQRLHPRGAAVLQVGDHDQVRLLAAELPPTLEVVDTRDEPGRGVIALLRRPAGG